MDLGKLSIFAMATKRMDWLSRRQEVLTQNIANADTPNYAAHDLKAQSFKGLLQPAAPQMQLAATDASHLGPTRPGKKTDDVVDKKTYESSPTGNGVVLEEQLLKVADTQASYRLAASLYSKHLSMIKAAIGRERG